MTAPCLKCPCKLAYLPRSYQPPGRNWQRGRAFDNVRARHRPLARIIHQAPAISFRRAELAGLTASF